MDGGDIGDSLRNPAHSAFRSKFEILPNNLKSDVSFLVSGCGSGDGQGRLEVPPRHGAQPGEVVDDPGVLVLLVDPVAVRRRNRRRSGQKRHAAVPVRRLHF